MTTRTAVPRETSKNGNGHKPVAEPELAPTQLIIAIPVDLVDVGPNVRVNLEGIDELAASIKEHGLKQPIKVRADGARWLVVYGQRRLLAHRAAGIERIPAIVADQEYTTGSLAIEQLVENLHRADLPPLDRARAMRAVVDAGTSQADLARELGLHPSTIANDLRLLTLDEGVQILVESGAISPSHAKAIASLPPKQQHDLAQRAVTAKWSAHQLEREIQWKQDVANQEERKAAKTVKWIPKAIAALEAAKVPKDVLIQVSGPTYELDVDAVRRAIQKAGWKKSSNDYLMRRPAAGKCDCTAIRLAIGGRKAEIEEVCSDSRHQDRAVNNNHVAEEKRRKAIAARVAELARLIEKSFEATPLHPIVLRIAYRRRSHQHEWAQLLEMPDAEVRRAYAQNLAEGVDPTYAYQDRVAAEAALEAAITALGGEAPA